MVVFTVMRMPVVGMTVVGMTVVISRDVTYMMVLFADQLTPRIVVIRSRPSRQSEGGYDSEKGTVRAHEHHWQSSSGIGKSQGNRQRHRHRSAMRFDDLDGDASESSLRIFPVAVVPEHPANCYK